MYDNESSTALILYPLNCLMVPLGSREFVLPWLTSSIVFRKSVKIVFLTIFFTILLLLKDSPADTSAEAPASQPNNALKIPLIPTFPLA